MVTAFIGASVVEWPAKGNFATAAALVGRQQLEHRRARLHALLANETDDRIKIWARVKLGGEGGVDVGRAFGYQNGSGVGQVIRRLEKAIVDEEELCSKVNQLKTSLSSVES